MREVLHFDKVSLSFRGQKILDEISFSLKSGEITFILGKSGMGKSVLLKTAVGFLQPDSGSLYLEGFNLTELKETELRKVRRKCGLIFQTPALFDSYTVFENLKMAMDLEDDPLTTAREHLLTVGLDPQCLHFFPHDLSYGEQKKVSIARALCPKPSLLLFDEPTTGLDPKSRDEIFTLIQKCAQNLNVGCLIVSHDLEAAFKIAHFFLFLNHGKFIVQQSNKSFQEKIRSFLKAPLLNPEEKFLLEFFKGSLFE